MELQEKKDGDVLVVKVLEERLDAHVAPDFKGKMSDFISNGNELIVLDMSQVDFIDTSGLSAVVSGLKKLGDRGDLVLCGVRAPILSLFHLTRLDRVVRTFSREEEAVSELRRTDSEESTGYKRIRLVVDSELENVSLVGMTISKLCSLIPLSDIEAYQIELCVVEAVNNCIEHAYGMERGHEVEVVFTLYPERLTVDVCDTGKPMDQECMDQESVSSMDIDPDDIDNIPEQGRGIALMNKIMDTMTYKTENGKNCLTLTKKM